MDKETLDLMEKLSIQFKDTFQKEFDRVQRNYETRKQIEAAKDAAKDFGRSSMEKVNGLFDPIRHRLDYNAVNREVQDLEKQLAQEIVTAKTYGMTPEQGDRIEDLSKIHSKKIERLMTAGELCEQDKAYFVKQIIKAKDAIIDKASAAYDSIHDSIDNAICSSLAAINGFKDTVTQTTDKAKEVGKEAFIGNEEKVEGIHRESLSRDAKEYDSMALHYDKLADIAEDKSFRRARALQNFKNVFRALRGQEDEKVNVQVEPSKYRQMAADFRSKAEQCRQQVEASLEQSAQRISQSKDIREALGMGINEKVTSLDKAIEKAKAEVQKDRETALNKEPAKTKPIDKTER